MIRHKVSLDRLITSIIAVKRDDGDDGGVLCLLLFLGWVG